MDTNKIEGLKDQVSGKIQEGIGSVTGDTVQQAKGRAQDYAGQAQSFYGDALDTMRDITADQPLIALGAALGAGFLLGALLTR